MNNTEIKTVEMAVVLLLILTFGSAAVVGDVTWTRKSSTTADMPAPSDGKAGWYGNAETCHLSQICTLAA